MRLIIVRHGKTPHNRDGIVSGHSQIGLSDDGVKEVEGLARELEGEDIDVVYCSDLKRGLESAKIINESHNAPLEVRAALRERDYGKHTGKSKPEGWVGIKRPDWDAPGGEGWEGVLSRVKGFVREIKSKHMMDCVLVVGHNGFLCVLIAYLLGEDVKDRLCAGLPNSKPVFIEVGRYSANLSAR